MIFSRKKKQRRDQGAGLAFNWRGFNGYQLDKLLALLLVVGILAMAIYVIKVDDLEPAMVSQRKAAVSIIDKNDPNIQNIMAMVDERSPFPARWDPAYDRGVLERITQVTQQIITNKKVYEGKFLPLPESIEEVNHRSISSGASSELMSDVKAWSDGFVTMVDKSAEPTSGKMALFFNVTFYDELEGVVAQNERFLHSGFVSQKAYGQSYKFIMSIDEQGEVLSCIPSKGGSIESQGPSDYHNLIAEWLHQQVFERKGSQAGHLVGQVEVQVTARRR